MILYAAYRDWAISACEAISCQNIIAKNDKDLQKYILDLGKEIEAIIFVGWSTLIEESIITSYLCMCYHPSDLPKYRGGSPLQHQIIDGVTLTNGTLFKMTSSLDAGPIYKKAELSLEGKMNNILNNLTKNAFILISSFINDISAGRKIILLEQNEDEATFYKRRTPGMSEIKISDIETDTGLSLYNKIRALGDPYPNAYIKTSDGRTILLKDVDLI